MKFKNFLSDLNGKNFTEKNVQDDGRIKISCICDETSLFLYELVSDLTIMGCTDIEVENGENEHVYDTNAMLYSIDNSPTIVPAEGGTDNG